LRSDAAETTSTLPLLASFFASALVFVLRRLSAWALPRPSAMASAKFAKSTVNHSHAAIWNSKPKSFPDSNSVRTIRAAVSTAPTSTTNMTGFFARVIGFSLTNESTIARRTIGGSNKGRARFPRDKPIDVESPPDCTGWVSTFGSCKAIAMDLLLVCDGFQSIKCSTMGPSERAGK
jgi:hypothetical protein